jgi:hypothetical protein
MRLPRLRAVTLHFGVQAHTLQVLTMTGWEKDFGF